jgi:hypothetical protein
MWSRGKFQGELSINGVTESLTLHVFLPETSIVIKDKEFTTCEHGTHRALSFSPCTLGMLRASGVEQIKKGKHYEVSGSDIGIFREGCSGGYGEGAYDSRDVRSIKLALKYFQDGIDVSVAGAAFPMQDPMARLESWRFEVLFTIPRAEIPSFFNLNELGTRTFATEYDLHAPRR